MQNIPIYTLACLTALMISGAAYADVDNFVLPDEWTRGEANSTYQFWDSYTASSVLNSPQIDENEFGQASLTDSAMPGSSSFITSMGNIYSFSAVINPRAIIPGAGEDAGETTRFLIQATSFGNEIDVNDVTINGIDLESLAGYRYQELARENVGEAFGPFSAPLIDHLWAFDVEGSAASYQIDWGWGSTSSSFGDFSVDTLLVVPEPASALLLFVGSGVVGGTRRSRKKYGL